MSKRFEVKIVASEELEDVLNSYEPYTLEPFAVVPFIHLSSGLTTHYKVVYKVVPEERLKECELLRP